MSHREITHIVHYDVKEKKYLYYSSAIRLFFGGLINVFIPGYIYQQTGNIYYFFLFLIINSGVVVLVNTLFSYKIINKFGTKISMLIGLPFLVLYYYCINNIANGIFYLYLAGIVLGFFTAFFWTGFHTDIAQSSKGDKNFGSKIALLYIIITIVGAIAPIIGGYFLDNGLQNILFIISSIGILLSGIPLLISAKKHKTLKSNTEIKLLKYLKENLLSPLGVTLISRSYVITFIGSYYWPLFVFIILGSFTKLGIITAVSTFVVIGLVYFTGKLSDKNKDDKLMKVNLSVQYFNRIFAVFIFLFSFITPFFIYIIDIFNKFTGNISTTLITKNLYKISGQNNKSNLLTIILSEVSMHLSRFLIVSGFFVLFYFFENSYEGIIYFPIILLLIMIPFQYSLFKNKLKL